MKERTFSKEETTMIKGLAVMMLIIYHSFSSVWRLSGYEVKFLFPKYGMQWANQCDICVGIFALLSVFGISRSFKGEDPFAEPASGRTYYVHRLVNLMLNFWVIAIPCFVITFFVTGLPYTSDVSGVERFFLDFFCMAGFFDVSTICGTWWYMSFAILIIVLIPFFYRIEKKRALSGTLLMTLLLMTLQIPCVKMTKWLPLIPIGIWLERYHIFEKIDKMSVFGRQKADTLIKTAVFAGGTYLFSYLAMSAEIVSQMQYLYHPLAAVCFVAFCYVSITKLRRVGSGLKIIGKHSMNIFLFHSFIRSKWLNGFTYSLGKTWLIFLFVLGISLVFSIVMEQIKVWVHYRTFEKKSEQWIFALIERICGKELQHESIV